jgi:F-box/leucine-rich repeat protein 14
VALLDGGLAAAAPFLSSLTSLNLQGCSSLTDAGLAKMGCLTALASLNLSECPGE